MEELRRGDPLVRKWCWPRSKHVFQYRIDPVPRTGVRYSRWSFGNIYRRPRTYQERRWSFAHEGFVRGRRKAWNFPNPWDDHPRSDALIKRSWKKNRKIRRQWMKNL